MRKARVTILMPVYNVSKYLRESIDSVLAQTYRDFILFILDDGSSDSTQTVVSAYNDARIIYTRNDTNIGLAANLNKGLSRVQTELVARMDGDDVAGPSWLAKNIRILDLHPEVGICSSGFQFFGTKHSVVRYPEHHDNSKVQMLFGCTIIVPVMRMSLFRDNNLQYDPNAFPAEDYELWSRCYSLTQVYNIQETLFYYRMHASQVSTSKKIAQIEKTNKVRLHMLSLLNPNLAETDKDYFLGDYGNALIRGEEDLQKMIYFGEKLEKSNVGTYDSKALAKRLRWQVTIAVLSYVMRTYWREGYSISAYKKYLDSIYCRYVPLKFQWRFLFKSIIGKTNQ